MSVVVVVVVCRRRVVVVSSSSCRRRVVCRRRRRRVVVVVVSSLLSVLVVVRLLVGRAFGRVLAGWWGWLPSGGRPVEPRQGAPLARTVFKIVAPRVLLSYALMADRRRVRLLLMQAAHTHLRVPPPGSRAHAAGVPSALCVELLSGDEVVPDSLAIEPLREQLLLHVRFHVLRLEPCLIGRGPLLHKQLLLRCSLPLLLLEHV